MTSKIGLYECPAKKLRWVCRWYGEYDPASGQRRRYSKAFRLRRDAERFRAAKQVELDNGTVNDIHVDCRGCAISVASASMMAEVIKGKSIEHARKIAEVVKKMLKGEDTDIPDDLGDLDALRGVRNFPVRIKCALLAWVTFMEGLKNHEKGHGDVHTSVSTEDDE